MGKTVMQNWTFASRFRRNAFDWKSQPAIAQVKQAVSEIKKADRVDAMRGAEGALLFFEKVSSALSRVDGSSGAIGTAVNHAVRELVPVISRAPADGATRDHWLLRLWNAYEADEMTHIESLGDHWGELAGSKRIASAWADRLLDHTRYVMSPDERFYEFFHGTIPCLSALFSAERYDEIVDLLADISFWPYKRWAVMSMVEQGRRAEAIRVAESCRRPPVRQREIDLLCEEILLSSGLVDEAYRRYGLAANRAGSNLAWFRAVARKYPARTRSEILLDLVATQPGDEGMWFAAAKSAGLYETAIELALRSPCNPRTLTRAARDFKEKNPSFAVEAGVAALYWIARGHGYDVVGDDVRSAYTHTMEAAEHIRYVDSVNERITRLAERPAERGQT